MGLQAVDSCRLMTQISQLASLKLAQSKAERSLVSETMHIFTGRLNRESKEVDAPACASRQITL